MRWAATAAVAVAIVLAVAWPFGGDSAPEPAAAATAGTALAAVERGRLTSQITAAGSLGYAARPDGSPYSVVNQAGGVVTSLPSPGDLVRCGEVLYRVDREPVTLLCGRTPMYRRLYEGLSGPDVRALNRALDVEGDEFTAATAEALGESGLEPADAVILPGPLRIAKVTAVPGAPARPGMPIAQATSTRRHVQVDLDASQASLVERGDRADVTLPDQETVRARVSRVGSVAVGEEAKIPVHVTLPRARGLDQAPVDVRITTGTVKDALSVPVTALLAVASGGYAVETAGAGGSRALVPVELGMFDHANGLVQVTGRLEAGQQVVVPST